MRLWVWDGNGNENGRALKIEKLFGSFSVWYQKPKGKPRQRKREYLFSHPQFCFFTFFFTTNFFFTELNVK